jgi:hypothetical protein
MLVLLITGILPLTFRMIKYKWRICFDGSFSFLLGRLFLFNLSLLSLVSDEFQKLLMRGSTVGYHLFVDVIPNGEVKIECSTKLPKLDEL